MADFANLLGSLSGMFQQQQAVGIIQQGASAQAQTIRIGGEIAAQGSLLSASGFRTSATAVGQATSFNLSIDKTNTQRKLKSITRQFQRTLGKQTSQVAKAGISVTSKSFLQLRNETLDVFGTALLNTKLDAENSKRAKIFESQVKQTNLENQARAAEFNAAAQRVMASNRAAEAEFQGEIAAFKGQQNLNRQLPTLLGQMFQE